MIAEIRPPLEEVQLPWMQIKSNNFEIEDQRVSGTVTACHTLVKSRLSTKFLFDFANKQHQFGMSRKEKERERKR